MNEIEIEDITGEGFDDAYPEVFLIKLINGRVLSTTKTSAAYYIMSYLHCTHRTSHLRDMIEVYESIQEIDLRYKKIKVPHYILQVKSEFKEMVGQMLT